MEEIKIPRVLNREILLLAGLALAAFGVFVFTRQMAAREQQLEAKIASIWYERGVQFMHSGDTAKAIAALRKATADGGDNRKYVLALATALIAENDDAEAQQSLLRLRESDPEDPEINILLARLAAKQNETQQAVHYYQNALYGRWSPDQDNDRRKIRIELVRYLLAHNQRDLASSELLILQGRTPASAPAHVELANLFVDAGDLQRAQQEYLEAVKLDSHNAEAFEGAGETSFDVGDYAKAAQYLQAALEVDPGSSKTRQLLELAEAVQNEDPLAPYISASERQQRILAAFDESELRLESCLSLVPEGSKANSDLKSLKDEATATTGKLKSLAHPPDADAVRSGVGVIFKMQQVISGYCGKPSVEDQALLLIGRQHSGGQP